MNNQDINPSNLITPPMSVEIEQAVIGAMLQSAHARDIATNLLDERIFFVEIHRLLFTTMLAMYLDSESVDVLTVNEKLKNEIIYKPVGVYYLTECINQVSSDGSIEHHCHILINYYNKRKLLEISNNIKIALDRRDSDKIISYIDMELQDIMKTKSTNKTMSLSEISKEYLIAFERQIKNEKDFYIKTYIPALDRKIGGFQGGEYVVIAGRPGMGKSSLGLQIFWDNIKHGNKPGFISIESSRRQMFQRLISFESGYSVSRIKAIKENDIEVISVKDTVGSIAKRNGYINDVAIIDPIELKNISRQMVKKYGVKFIVVDYLQLFDSEGESENVRLTKISMAIKRIAKELNIPIFIISQLSRQKRDESDREPVNSDLRGSGSIEQDADVIMFLYKNKNDDYKIIVTKRRDGATGYIPVVFFAEKMRFGELIQE